MTAWFEVTCDYGDCRWHSDMGRRDDNMMWNQYREHKRTEHPEKCGKCPGVENKYACVKCSKN